VNIVGGVVCDAHEGTSQYIIPKGKFFQADPGNFKFNHFLGDGAVKLINVIVGWCHCCSIEVESWW
jgi:hypothetical protein